MKGLDISLSTFFSCSLKDFWENDGYDVTRPRNREDKYGRNFSAPEMTISVDEAFLSLPISFFLLVTIQFCTKSKKNADSTVSPLSHGLVLWIEGSRFYGILTFLLLLYVGGKLKGKLPENWSYPNAALAIKNKELIAMKALSGDMPTKSQTNRVFGRLAL